MVYVCIHVSTHVRIMRDCRLQKLSVFIFPLQQCNKIISVGRLKAVGVVSSMYVTQDSRQKLSRYFYLHN